VNYRLSGYIDSERLEEAAGFGTLSFVIADDPAGAIRLTAIDPLFPSSLLTVTNII
jgi:hypothetical protein